MIPSRKYSSIYKDKEIIRELKNGWKSNLNEKSNCAAEAIFCCPIERIAITLSPNYYKKMQRFTTRKNQEEHGPDVK
jgi:hypothetical protein